MNTDYIEYVVKKGDSLYEIAKRFKTTIAELLDVNMLTTNVIYPNQVLLVPVVEDYNKVVYDEYIVRKNDTMEKISNMTGVDIELLGAYNDFGKIILQENQKIIIPQNERSLKEVLKEVYLQACELEQLIDKYKKVQYETNNNRH